MLALVLLACLLAQEPAAPIPDVDKPDAGWKSLAPGIWFDPAGRRVVLRAKVVLREGGLEHLVCSVGTKEHESILATSAPAKMIHAALLLTGAEPGKPAQFDPEFRPPTGPAIQIQVAWTDPAGKRQIADARSWVKDEKTGRPMSAVWVFAGSMLYKDPDTGETRYSAEGGDLITVANFTSAILDVADPSPASGTALLYAARTEVIPPLDTVVSLVLQPAQGNTPRGKEARR